MIQKFLIKLGATVVASFGLVLLLGLTGSPIEAQAYGLDTNNYFCPEYSGLTRVSEIPNQDFKCSYRDTDNPAVIVQRNPLLKPPPLQILQVWFVRILYVIWGTAGVIFTFVLIGIGIRYMLSFGNVDAVGKVVETFQKWVAGLALVFLAYPILATLFQLLPLNRSACFSDLDLPAFQFFFPTACGSSCLRQCEEDYADILATGGGRYALEAYNNCTSQCQ